MPIKYVSQHGDLLLTCRGGLTIFQAAERKPELLHALTQEGRAVLVDLSGVDEIDTAGVQLLLLLKREVERSGRRIEVVAYSPAVLAVFDLLQLHAWFGLEDAAQGAAA